MADEKKVATREENLKKINEELEKLSEEELDNVAGGLALEKKELFKDINSDITQTPSHFAPF